MPGALQIIGRVADWVLKKGVTSALRRVGLYRSLMSMVDPASILPSGRKILSMMRGAGIGIRTTDFYKMYTSFKNIPDARRAVLSRPTNKTVPDSIMPIYPGTPETKYMYEFTFPVVGGYRAAKDVPASESVNRTFRMGTNVKYTPDTAARKFVEKFGAVFREHGADMSDLSFAGMYRRG